LCSAAVLAFLVCGLLAADKDNDAAKNKSGQHATITKVDAKNGTVTVRMKDHNGKEVKKTFHLTGEVQMFDDNGKVLRATDLDFFRSGDYVLVVEREGKLREIHKEKHATTGTDQKKPVSK
jgi:uncharacterized protein YigE (DUF2233 family)